MRETLDEDAELDSPRSSVTPGRAWSEGVFVTLLFAAILVAPFPMAANRVWAWSPLAVLVGALAVWHALGLGTPRPAFRPAERWPLVLLVACFAAVVAIAVLQVSPLSPAAWHSALYEQAAKLLEHPVTSLITIDADASRASLMKIAACGAVFVMARGIFGTARRARLFLLLFVAAAVLVTAYGLVMHATNGSCYVFSYNKRPEDTPEGRVFLCLFSGTFVSSNAYAAYAGMALVAALGLILSRRSSRSEMGSSTAGPPAATWLTATRLFCLVASCLLFGGLLLSSSRAGFAASLAGFILVGLLLMRGRWPSAPGSVWVIPAVILSLAVFVLIAGSAFFGKVERFSEVDLLGRLRIWQMSWTAFTQAPWLGWGLGTFGDVYTMLQSPDVRVANDKAHSTPLQWLVEFGAPGALCAFGTVLVPLAVCLRGALRRRTDRHLPAVALVASLVTVVHSLVDFSIEMPAIGLTVAMLLGMGWTHAFRRNE